jgi:hypothetical protein
VRPNIRGLGRSRHADRLAWHGGRGLAPRHLRCHRIRARRDKACSPAMRACESCPQPKFAGGDLTA